MKGDAYNYMHGHQVSLVVAMVWSFISLVYYGILPAFFTLLVVFSGVSLSKLIL